MWTTLTSLQPEALSSKPPQPTLSGKKRIKKKKKMLNVVRVKAKINVKCSNSIS
jgi:hypothetical protein